MRPYEPYAGHPANSSLSFYEDFVTHLANTVIADRELFRTTAIVITTDEGGGYYDFGYIQPIDFFGDGTRIPLIVISPFTNPGHVDHTYYDHASILKFIERNWGLPPLSPRSRDNLPNSVHQVGSYAPRNAPAIGDLVNVLDFQHPQDNPPIIVHP